jgi:hypothetical protein
MCDILCGENSAEHAVNLTKDCVCIVFMKLPFTFCSKLLPFISGASHDSCVSSVCSDLQLRMIYSLNLLKYKLDSDRTIIEEITLLQH